MNKQYVSSKIFQQLCFIALSMLLNSCFEAKKFEPILKDQVYQDVEQVDLLITNYCPTLIDPSHQKDDFFALNRNLRLTATGFDLDTDGDGISDAMEKFYALEYGVNYQKYDSNNDHYPDSVVIRMGLKSADQKNLPAIAPLDSDGDGLPDALELFLGTNPLDADTDHDGLSDELELFMGTNPLLADMNIDTDLDGISNLAEIKALTPIDQSNNSSDERVKKHIEQYTVKITENPQADRAQCYQFHVKGFPIMTSLANNWLELVFVERQDGNKRVWKHINLRIHPDIEQLYKQQKLQRGQGSFPTLEFSYEDILKADPKSDVPTSNSDPKAPGAL